MANSGMNPVIYAWKNRTFRRAFIHLLRCKAPDSHALIDDENARQNMKRKSSSLAPSLSAPPPTPNSVSATPPAISVSEPHHRSSLHRYHFGYVTAFPLPPPPPSPQSPIQSMETIVVAQNGTSTVIPPSSYAVDCSDAPMAMESQTAVTKCCLNVIDSDDNANIDIENNNDEQLNNQQPYFLHPSMNRWHALTKNQIIIDDDVSKTNYKHFNNNDLFLHKLTSTSPAESIVSAPLTPTGNLIVNILGNLDNGHQHANNTEAMNRKNYRNSTNCIIGRNSADENASVNSLNSIAAVAFAENRLNGQILSTATTPSITTAIPITSKAMPNGHVQCVTIAINNNDATDTILHCCDDEISIKSNSLYCTKSYSLSSSAPQFINCWNDPT